MYRVKSQTALCIFRQGSGKMLPDSTVGPDERLGLRKLDNKKVVKEPDDENMMVEVLYRCVEIRNEHGKLVKQGWVPETCLVSVEPDAV